MKEATVPRKAGPVRGKSLYSVHPGVQMVQKWIAELPAKTGRSLEGAGGAEGPAEADRETVPA